MKYLFTALFKDATFYEQTAQDISRVNPAKSAFFDILEQEKQGNSVVMFCLVGGGNDYLVDLRDGHFEVNGVPFIMHSEGDLSNFRLVYFRNRKQHFNLNLKCIGEETVFNFGWQANTSGGQNIQRIMSIQ